MLILPKFDLDFNLIQTQIFDKIPVETTVASVISNNVAHNQLDQEYEALVKIHTYYQTNPKEAKHEMVLKLAIHLCSLDTIYNMQYVADALHLPTDISIAEFVDLMRNSDVPICMSFRTTLYMAEIGNVFESMRPLLVEFVSMMEHITSAADDTDDTNGSNGSDYNPTKEDCDKCPKHDVCDHRVFSDIPVTIVASSKTLH